PEMRTVKTEDGEVVYLNSGDWVENLTALEYNDKKWTVFKYDHKDFQNDEAEDGILSDGENLHSKLDINILLEKIKLEIV
ncbi:MAG: UDP-2,3-diacylglucosamine diphosphatase, partial [Pedobacter sp.]|nr:UDP-2,3-diacylglucosamine diphosphatase [Pedobacter sp.]